ncbi:DUF4236 domain-containing protein [Polyangium sorediatum]|uniref:DUF4236 domain-containing protein n=1 Tax=Polyangium sorediatum TaxID=889274 RepID=A0ABT6NPJ6_9BACT|nr:DUF4236 domain-containing protein [Polyangium sorediatum]MDI1430245.1 DUF4236 domain-containing protein [Polyangium sorediatum]
MALRFHKNIKISGGFRVNLSSRGIGASWGVPGFRVSTGPAGSRAHFGVPGTGLHWSQNLGAGQRVGSSAGAQCHQMLAVQHDPSRAPYFDPNRHEVELHEQHIRALTTLHHEGWSPWDWHRIAASPPPPQPYRQNHREAAALQALQAHRPGVLGKLTGADRRLEELQQAVHVARAQDEQEYGAHYAAYMNEVERWKWFQRAAQGVLSGDPEACQAVLDHLGPFQAFQQLGSSLNVCITRPWCVEAWLTANDQSVLPAEAVSYTSTGRISRKTMPTQRYWSIYQDHVCSAALRIAREVFAILRIPVTLVHVAYPWTNTRTGLPDRYPILSVAFDIESFFQLRLEAIDPSDSMANFEHRMEHKKNSGLDPIEPLTPDDIEQNQG